MRLLGPRSPLGLQLALDHQREFGKLGMLFDLLPVTRVGIDDEVVAVENALLHLGHDLGK